ncbi:MAG TPA: carboxypeptidase-like regulatory domain-containing protein [Chitinophagaceae bacterium]|nr:carboxypeptidase-like regulatory domain-containing protein [Chitinophagaceae bacterium]
MKQRILLLIAICTLGWLQSKASGIEPINPGIPGKISEVAGNIVDGDSKKPLQNVTVTAYSTTRKEKFVLTDEFGRFEFDELKTGTYKLVFEKDGYRKVVRDKVAIKADETFQMRIEMIEAEGFDLMPSPFQFFDTK